MKNLQTLQPSDYLEIIKRRWLLILLPPILFGITGVLFVRTIKDVYISETVILVEPPKIPAEYVRATAIIPIDGRLSTITQQIMSRTRLEKIIMDNNLYEEMRRVFPMEEVVETMRKDILLRVVKADAFTLAYQSQNPVVAQRVAQQIASLYIEENLKAREEQTEGVSQFLQVQLQETEMKLKELEVKLSEFKSRNMGALPEQEQANLSMLTRLQQQLQSSIDSNNRLQDERVYQQRLLSETQALRNQEQQDQTAVDVVAASHLPSPMPGGLAPSPLDMKRAELTVLLQRYTKDHPDVRKVMGEIALMEKAQAGSAKDPATPAGSAGSDGPLRSPRRTSPADTEIAQMKSRIELLNDQIKQGSKEQAKVRQDMALYQARVEAVPRIEQMQKEISRDYEITNQHYQTLLTKKNDAEMATSLEKRQKGEQFRVIDPASLPQKPAKPKRLMLNLIGFIAGLGFGLVFTIILEIFDESIRSEHELANLAGVPVLVSIPWIDNSGDPGNQKRWWGKMKLPLFHHKSP
jgi:polysaccharide chain length determinant protein (PEP-CTERM system associated)